LADSTDPQTGESSLEAFLYLFFRPSPTSQAAGRSFWERRHLRKHDIDRPSTPQTAAAQRAAIVAWSAVGQERYAELDNIKQPTLVVNGNDDIMIPTISSYNLSQKIPRAQLIIYPDSGHLFQFPELFVTHGICFWTRQPDHQSGRTMVTNMSRTDSNANATTQSVRAGDNRYSSRRFGAGSGVPSFVSSTLCGDWALRQEAWLLSRCCRIGRPSFGCCRIGRPSFGCCRIGRPSFER
jgi:hypothetical protein